MSDEERRRLEELVSEIAATVAANGATQEAFYRQYARDEERKEVSRIEERQEKRIFRDEMIQKVDALETKISPVVKHHEMAVSATRFLLKYGTPSGVLGAIAWLWNHLKDRPN